MRSELCTADASRNLTPLGNPQQDTGYLYDRAGNIWKQLERITDGGYSPTKDALDRLYTYDALYRLLSATGRETEYVKKPAPADVLWDSGPWDDKIGKAQGYKEEYQYDSVGFLKELKRTSFTSSGPQVHTRTYSGFLSGTAQVNNRLASVSYPDPSPMPGSPISVPYTYDSAGNCLSEGVERKYEWDHLGRLRSFRNQTSDSAEPTQYVHYLYDAAGQRVKKLNRKQKGKDWDATTYIDGLLELRHEQRSMAAKEGLTLHLMDGQKRLGRRRINETFDKKPDNLLVLGDHLGSANVELDWEKGTLVDREEFRPYGETSFGSYELKRYRFTGKERDEESGLSYHGARYYAPGLGRWMSPDPKGTVDGVNLYGYVRGNPAILNDPSGRESNADATVAPRLSSTATPEVVTSSGAPSGRPPATPGKAAETSRHGGPNRTAQTVTEQPLTDQEKQAMRLPKAPKPITGLGDLVDRIIQYSPRTASVLQDLQSRDGRIAYSRINSLGETTHRDMEQRRADINIDINRINQPSLVAGALIHEGFGHYKNPQRNPIIVLDERYYRMALIRWAEIDENTWVERELRKVLREDAIAHLSVLREGRRIAAATAPFLGGNGINVLPPEFAGLPIDRWISKLSELERQGRSDEFIINSFTDTILTSNRDYGGYRQDLIKEYWAE